MVYMYMSYLNCGGQIVNGTLTVCLVIHEWLVKIEKKKKRKKTPVLIFFYFTVEGQEAKSKMNGRQQPEKKLSMNTLESGPVNMRRELLSQLALPDPSKKKPKVPQKIAAGVKELLQANKRGIWVSRFLMEYRVCGEVGWVKCGEVG